MIQQGATATNENWRDNYRTPQGILDRMDLFWKKGWFDPCPKNPTFDGLAIDWTPPCFVNPQFSRYAEWLKHGLNQVNEQIWICNNNTDSGWFQDLLQVSDAVLLTNYRIHFIDPRTDKPATDTRQGQALFYRGLEVERFKEYFNDMGFFIKLEKENN